MIDLAKSSGDLSNTISFVSPKHKLSAKHMSNFIPGGDPTGH